MRILILSDLHLDMWGGATPVRRPDPAPDIVVLAGDIHVGARAVTWAAETFPSIPVLYVTGNHEAYGFHLGVTEAAISSSCIAHQDVHFLQMGEFILDDVRFLGCTLWTDFALFGEPRSTYHMRHAERCMNDYRIVTTGGDGRRLTPADTLKINQAHKAWLTAKLAEPFAGKTFVITHHLPSLRSVAERYKTDPLTSAFASHHDDLVAQADYWVHGHTHDSMDYQLGACRVVCNPCGYPTRGGIPENSQFNPTLMIDVAHP